MIDVILMAETNEALAKFGLAHGLLVPDGEGGWKNAKGVDWAYWAGSGLMKRSLGKYDAEGNTIAEPEFVPGLAIVLRLFGEFYKKDGIKRDGEWIKSKTLQFIYDNGTAGEVEGIPYHEIDGVRILKPSDVIAKLSEWGVPGHEFSGGNAL